MVQYIGCRAIAKRLGISNSTLLRKFKQRNYPAYLIRIKGNGVRWVSNDDLIFAWEREQVKKCSQAYRTGQRRSDRMQRDDESINYAA